MRLQAADGALAAHDERRRDECQGASPGSKGLRLCFIASLAQDLPLRSGALVSVFRNGRACIADTENYSIIDLEAAEALPLLPISQVSRISPAASVTSLMSPHSLHIPTLSLPPLPPTARRPRPRLRDPILDNDPPSPASLRASTSSRATPAARPLASLSTRSASRAGARSSGRATCAVSVRLDRPCLPLCVF